MKALFVLCTLAVLFNFAPLGAQAGDLSLSAPITPNGTLMHVNARVGGEPASAQITADPGIIAYVKRSTDDIHVISPDGTGDRVLWTIPQPFVDPAYDLAWRPDGQELAFSSGHEQACSWYDSDIYAIGYNGAGYRRVTNSPACAALAGLPKGSVTVDVSKYTSELAWVYVQGAPEVKSVLDSGTVTFDNVADFGPGVHQPSIGIWGLYRFTSYPPYADVQPGQTVPGGNVVIMQYGGFTGFGAGKVSWKADGSALGYGMRSSSGISQIPAIPPYGSTGAALPVVKESSPGLVAWGPTLATKDLYLYSSGMNVFKENVGGIYLNTVGDASGGTQVVLFYDYSAERVYDIEWLPDASGFLFTRFHVELGYFSDIYEYNFATQSITQLTPSLNDESGDGGARGLSISPDGQQIVFERAFSDPLVTTSSLWTMNRDGSNLHKLADDAGRPAWGRTPTGYDLTISISPLDAGSVSRTPDKTVYDSGEEVILTASPSKGFSFGNWSGDISGTVNPISINMSGAKSVVATFVPDSTAVNGQCGSANGGILTSAPTTDLCSQGTPSEVSGTGPWTWTCQGINGGTDATCSVDRAATCDFNVSSIQSISYKSRTVSLKVTASDKTCPAPEVVNKTDWIVDAPPTWSRGKGAVKLTVSANATAYERSREITLGQARVTITQQGAPCKLGAFTPQSGALSASGSGATGSLSFSLPEGCEWTAAADPKSTWLTIQTLSGDGSGVVTYSAGVNSTGKVRTGKINITLVSTGKPKAYAVKQGK